MLAKLMPFTGTYDFVKIEAESRVKERITDNLRTIDKIRSALMLIAVEN